VLLSLDEVNGQIERFLKPSTIEIPEGNPKAERKELLKGIKFLKRAIFENN
jgi:hypothetical protein